MPISILAGLSLLLLFLEALDDKAMMKIILLSIQGCLFSHTIAVINQGPVMKIYKPKLEKTT